MWYCITDDLDFLIGNRYALKGDMGVRHKVIFLWGPVVTLALLLGSVGLLRLYIAEAAEVLVAELTGAGAHVGGIDISYFPPSVTIHNLKLESGDEQFNAPRVDLFPNFSKLFDGEVSLDRAIFDKPLVTMYAESSGGSFNADLLPQSITIQDASLIIRDDEGASSPVTLTADIQQGSGAFSLDIKRASIPEFGLSFSGELNITSFAPLKLHVVADSGSFNPSNLLDFLHRFKYLDEADLLMFSGTQSVSAEGLDLVFDAESRSFVFSAQSFVVDDSNLVGFEARVAPDGRWQIACSGGQLDAPQMLALLNGHPDSSKAFQDGISTLGVKSFTADGLINLKAVQLHSVGKSGKASGVVSLDTPSLTLHIVSESGEKQDLTINDFEGEIGLKEGKPSVSVNSMNLMSSLGGEAVVKGDMPIPFAFAGTRFQVEARQLQWFDVELDGTAEKKSTRQVDVDLAFKSGGASVRLQGLVRNELSGSNRWAAVIDDLAIRTVSHEKGDASPEEPFDFGFVKDGTLSGRIAVRRLQYNDLPVVRDMTAKVVSAKGQTSIKGRGRICLMQIGFESVLAPDALASRVDIKGSNLHLPGVMGCFVDELPVYVRGRMTIFANLVMQGKTARQVEESMAGDALVRFKDLNVLKLSNLDSRLGFFLEMMNAVGLEPDKGDTLSFRSGMVSALVVGQNISLKSVRLVGSQLSVAGEGQYNLSDKKLLLDAQITTPFGVNKTIQIDKFLGEEKVS